MYIYKQNVCIHICSHNTSSVKNLKASVTTLTVA
jgi:hypothetical protein